MSTQEATVEVLRAAREYLFEHGWMQGEYEDEGGQVCLEGACRKPLGLPTRASDDPDENDDETWAAAFNAEAAISRTLGIPGVVTWNDDHDRTFDEVINAIDLTIKRLEEPS
jgi:hypothetical protein